MFTKVSVVVLAILTLVGFSQSASAGWVVMSDHWCLHNGFAKGCQVYNGGAGAIAVPRGNTVSGPIVHRPHAGDNKRK